MPVRPQVPIFNDAKPSFLKQTTENLQPQPQPQTEQDETPRRSFSFRAIGAKVVSAVTEKARNFISEVYKEEIQAADDEMRSDGLQDIEEEEAEEEQIDTKENQNDQTFNVQPQIDCEEPTVTEQ